MPKITILQGLPASGKTSFAKKQQAKDPNTKRVNKDDLRSMLDNSRWSKSNEKFILKVRDYIVSEALKDGHNVIIDDTNLAEKHITRLKEIAKETNSQVIINNDFLKVSLEECIERDLKRPNSVGEKVITSMYNQFLKPKSEFIVQDNILPLAVIFDIDGTLANMGDRSPYDWNKVNQDLPNAPVIKTLQNYQKAGYKIGIFTGRDGVCEKATKDWLAKNNITYDFFEIRPTDNTEKDSVIKRRMLGEYLGKYYIEAIYDDRDQVVEMWRSLGLQCFQVNYGNF